MPKTVNVFVTNACNLYCLPCKADDPFHRDEKTMLDLCQTENWIEMYAPGCAINVMGGEPLKHPMINSFLYEMHRNGHEITLMTNATLLKNNPYLYDLDIRWHLTHHPESGVSYEQFFENVEPLKNKKHVVARLYYGKEALNHRVRCEERYKGYNFKWIGLNSGYMNYSFHSYVDECPNSEMVLIGTKGEVYCCSKPSKGQFGNVHDMTFDTESASKFRCPLYPSKCQAMQTNEIMRDL